MFTLCELHNYLDGDGHLVFPVPSDTTLSRLARTVLQPTGTSVGPVVQASESEQLGAIVAHEQSGPGSDAAAMQTHPVAHLGVAGEATFRFSRPPQETGPGDGGRRLPPGPGAIKTHHGNHGP